MGLHNGLGISKCHPTGPQMGIWQHNDLPASGSGWWSEEDDKLLWDLLKEVFLILLFLLTVLNVGAA